MVDEAAAPVEIGFIGFIGFIGLIGFIGFIVCSNPLITTHEPPRSPKP